MLHTWVELVVIVLIGAAAMAVFVGILSSIPFPEPHKIYEREYAACMGQDTLTHEQCHDIALEAID